MVGNILIADDNRENLRILREILSSDGHQVRTADRGEIALRSVKELPPDLILLDILMPGMDGFELCRLIKADPASAAIPLLFISALADTREKVKAFEAGAVDYITRPFVAREVSARVRNHLGLASAQRQLFKANRDLVREIETRRTVEEQYRDMFEQCPDSMAILDPESMKFVAFNTAAHTRLGYEREEFAKLTLLDIAVGLTPGELAAGAETLEREGRAVFELRDRTKSGEIRDVLVSVSKVIFDGRPMFQSVVKDISEQKTTEKELRISDRKYRALFEHSKDAILVSDPDGRLVDVNRAAVHLFGYAKEEFLSTDPERLYCNPEDRVRLWNELYKYGVVDDYELEMKKKDGDKIIVHLSVSVLKDDEGNIFGHRGIVRDVTERKQLERQLLQSQKLESVGLLAGGIAHDFNNLLTAISGYGQMLRESIPADNETSHDSIEQILKAAQRAAELTRSLLAFSRKQVINPKPVNPASIIDNTGKLIRRVIGEDIEFSTSFTGTDLRIMADAGQLEQVLMNLATNARDAMPFGGLLSISMKEEVVNEGSEALFDLPAPGRYALISVADTGNGIDLTSMERLFEPFYTTKEVGKGTGLGLSIVYGIVKQHNGSVLVCSEPEKGTTFNIYLPLVEESAAAEPAPPQPVVTQGAGTILIAEDEEIVKTYLQKTLERAGYRILTASDGEEAVNLFREHDDISLVLSDVLMPRKNGRELLGEMRKIKPDIRVIFISGYTADIMQKRGIFEEGFDFIAKPFTKNQVLQKIRDVMDRTY